MTDPDDDDHWVNRARDFKVGPRFLFANPLVGVVGEDDHGELYVPSFRNPHPGEHENWWGRPLNLRNPLHWAPYLRSRITHKVVMLCG